MSVMSSAPVDVANGGKVSRVVPEDVEKGPEISHKVSKVLEDCVRDMVDKLPATQKKENKSRVRRPMNSFMIYSQTARKAMAKRYPTLSYRKLSKALGKIWKVLNAEEKRPFMKEAERLRRLHKQEYPGFKFKPGKGQKRKDSPCLPDAVDFCPNMQDVRELIGEDWDRNVPGLDSGGVTSRGGDNAHCSFEKPWVESSGFANGSFSDASGFHYEENESGVQFYDCGSSAGVGHQSHYYQGYDTSSLEEHLGPVINHFIQDLPEIMPEACNTLASSNEREMHVNDQSEAVAKGYPGSSVTTPCSFTVGHSPYCYGPSTAFSHGVDQSTVLGPNQTSLLGTEASYGYINSANETCQSTACCPDN